MVTSAPVVAVALAFAVRAAAVVALASALAPMVPLVPMLLPLQIAHQYVCGCCCWLFLSVVLVSCRLQLLFLHCRLFSTAAVQCAFCTAAGHHWRCQCTANVLLRGAQWTEYADEQSGRPYFVDRETGASSWTLPAGALASRDLSRPPLPLNWYITSDAGGSRYYCNTVTKQVGWEPPSSPLPPPTTASTAATTSAATVMLATMATIASDDEDLSTDGASGPASNSVRQRLPQKSQRCAWQQLLTDASTGIGTLCWLPGEAKHHGSWPKVQLKVMAPLLHGSAWHAAAILSEPGSLFDCGAPVRSRWALCIGRRAGTGTNTAPASSPSV